MRQPDHIGRAKPADFSAFVQMCIKESKSGFRGKRRCLFSEKVPIKAMLREIWLASERWKTMSILHTAVRKI